MARRKASNPGSAMSKFLKAFGLNVDGKEAVGEVIKASTDYLVAEATKQDKLTRELEMAKERTTLEAESVLFYVLTKGDGFSQKSCKICNRIFASTYYAVAFCSATCRYKALAEAGIAWNIYGKTDLERWGGRIPKTLSPEALKAALYALELEAEAERLAEEKAIELEINEEDVTPVDYELEEVDIELQEIKARYEEE